MGKEKGVSYGSTVFYCQCVNVTCEFTLIKNFNNITVVLLIYLVYQTHMQFYHYIWLPPLHVLIEGEVVH